MQTVLAQPRRQSFVAAQFFLQSLQSLLTRLEFHQLGGLAVRGFLGLAAVVFYLLDHGLEFVELGLRLFGQSLSVVQLLLQLCQLSFIGRGQRITVSLQTLQALLQLAGLFLQTALFSRQHFHLLLYLVDRFLLLLHLFSGVCPGLLQCGQTLLAIF